MNNYMQLSLAVPEAVADDGVNVRVVGDPDMPQFVVNDLESILGIANMKRTVAGFDDDEKGVTQCVTPGGTQQLVTVYESGLYRLLFTSRKPTAKRFQRWVLHEVMPSIRKHGCYPPPATPPAPVLTSVSPYHHRMIEGYQFSASLPSGYWGVFGQSHTILSVAERIFHLSGLTMDYDDLLDGSVGRMWSSYRKGKEWASADVRVFDYRFPPPSKRANLTVHPNCYPNSELAYFHPWMADEYAVCHFPGYLRRKLKGDYQKALPHIRAVMPRALN